MSTSSHFEFVTQGRSHSFVAMFGIQVYLNDRILFEMAKFVMQMQRGNERDAT